MATTRLMLVRHGETEWNSVGRWQGHADPPLNDIGREQARLLADQFHAETFAAIYASDLRRASETARIVGDALGLGVIENPALREIDVGSWSGLTRAEVAERFPEGFARWQEGAIGHDGETREALAARVERALLRLADANAGQRLLVITHGGVIRAARRLASGDPGGPVPNCGTVELTVVDGRLFPGSTATTDGRR